MLCSVYVYRYGMLVAVWPFAFFTLNNSTQTLNISHISCQRNISIISILTKLFRCLGSLRIVELCSTVSEILYDQLASVFEILNVHSCLVVVDGDINIRDNVSIRYRRSKTAPSADDFRRHLARQPRRDRTYDSYVIFPTTYVRHAYVILPYFDLIT